jgi:hypothetical protein
VDVYDKNNTTLQEKLCTLNLVLPELSITAPLDGHPCSYSYTVTASALDSDSNNIVNTVELKSSSGSVSDLKTGFSINPSVSVSNTYDGATDRARLLYTLYTNSAVEYLEISVKINIVIDGVTITRWMSYSIDDADINRESVITTTDGNGNLL